MIEKAAPASGGTQATKRMVALEREAAFAKLAGDDPRPLLILRECGRCKGTEDALLSRKLDNEKTQLMARWFHCVKFKPNVLEKTHTFREVFDAEKPAHLILCSPDGSNLVTFDGAQSQTDLWNAMEKLVGLHYVEGHERPLKKLTRLLEKFDQQDAEEDQVREKIDMELEGESPNPRRLAELRRDLEKLEKQRKSLEKEREKLLDLERRPLEEVLGAKH